MPNAAKLFAALSLALVGWIASDMIKPLLPFSVDFGWFNYVNATIGFLVGWLFLGPRAGQGPTAVINNGITSAVVMVVVGLFVQATNEMVRLSFARRYDDPFEAVAAIFEIVIEYAVILWDVQLIIVLLAGGIISAFVSEVVGKFWR
ncbi:TrgA family protein [Antarctobacter jejuensis]|uniref:TrgA family protein n=1 Tax=Antarctobacter jejuensis TaxID=1439938 RepID=UPI003FD5C1C3